MERIGIEGCIVGDILLSKRLNILNPCLKQIHDIFQKVDVVIGNLETTVHNNEGNPAVFPGGSYTLCPPSSLKDLYDLNFRMFNIANNHMMDYGEKGLSATINYLNDYDFEFCGAGLNLAEANRPCYYEAPYGRIAMVGASSSGNEAYIAGPQGYDTMGRAGVNPLRYMALYQLPEIDFNHLKRIASKIGINDAINQARKDGYRKASEYEKFGNYNFVKSDKYGIVTVPKKEDISLLISSVKEANNNADMVIVHLHTHQFKEGNKANEAEFIQIASRMCIDEGADIVVCHGPHILRRIEKYNNRYIFYSLGNFIFQHTMMERLPEEFYSKFGTTRRDYTGVSEIMSIRGGNGERGLHKDPLVWESVIVKFSKIDNSLDIELIPIRIHKDGIKANIGLPYIITKDEAVKTNILFRK